MERVGIIRPIITGVRACIIRTTFRGRLRTEQDMSTIHGLAVSQADALFMVPMVRQEAQHGTTRQRDDMDEPLARRDGMEEDRSRARTIPGTAAMEQRIKV